MIEAKVAGEGIVDPPVHEVAGKWGFHHTGNFGADYHRLFGELPSETLGNG